LKTAETTVFNSAHTGPSLVARGREERRARPWRA
jgi:hypothetical protein